jgi:hypothetical protein
MPPTTDGALSGGAFCAIASELVARAAAAGCDVVIDDLGTWGGRARLFAEYDPQTSTIRIDRRAIALVRARGGELAEHSFIAYAIAHELAHAADLAGSHEAGNCPAGEGTLGDRSAGERRAHAAAEAQTGVTAASLEGWFMQ